MLLHPFFSSMNTLLPLVLFAPLLGWAQAPLPHPVVVASPLRVEQALRSLANPRLLQVPRGTFLYRHLRNTLGQRYACPLPPGDWELTLVRAVNPHWVAVRWRPYSAPFAAGDTALFYLPAQQGLRTIILL